MDEAELMRMLNRADNARSVLEHMKEDLRDAREIDLWLSVADALDAVKTFQGKVRRTMMAREMKHGGTYLDQIAEAKRDMEQWPEWMKDAAMQEREKKHG